MKKNILVATRELHGGTDKGGPAVVKAHEELTAEHRKALGLDAKGVEALVADGTLIEVPARIAESGDHPNDAAVLAATDRADKAEQALAEANETIATLTSQLEEAKKAPPAKA